MDLVHGHSSHHIKGIEVHHGRLVLYGCGDLITDYEGISGREAYRGDLGLLYFPDIDPATGQLKALHMQPTQMYQLRLCRPSDDDIAWIRDSLNDQSQHLGTRIQRDDNDHLYLEWSP